MVMIMLIMSSAPVSAAERCRKCEIYDNGKEFSVKYKDRYRTGTNGACETGGPFKYWTVPENNYTICAKYQWADHLASRIVPEIFITSREYSKTSKRARNLINASENARGACYQSGNRTKQECDRAFKKNLMKTQIKFHGLFSIGTVANLTQTKTAKEKYEIAQVNSRNHNKMMGEEHCRKYHPNDAETKQK